MESKGSINLVQGEYTIPGNSKVHLDSEIVMKFSDGKETSLKVRTSADLGEIPEEQQEMFLRTLIRQYNKQYNIHSFFRSDGSAPKSNNIKSDKKKKKTFWKKIKEIF
jgi:hypothetical protein